MFHLHGRHGEVDQTARRWIYPTEVHERQVAPVFFVAFYAFVVVYQIAASVYYQFAFVHLDGSYVMG